jgi:hypothetical protein
MCVGISSEPDESQDWFCMRCVAKSREQTQAGGSGAAGSRSGGEKRKERRKR